MLGMMYNKDLTQDGPLVAEGCYTGVGESSHHLVAASQRTSDDELAKYPSVSATYPSVASVSAASGSGTALRPVEEETEKPPYFYVVDQHDNLLNQLTSRWVEKKDQIQATRDEIRKIAQQILLDAMASEWLAGDAESTQVRIYIVDDILPTLILGIEKLLMEVEKRNLVDAETPDRNFNPINFLAQYLMRNNPKYSNFSEASPYIRGLRSVAEQLKLELYNVTEYKYVNRQLTYHVFDCILNTHAGKLPYAVSRAFIGVRHAYVPG